MSVSMIPDFSSWVYSRCFIVMHTRPRDIHIETLLIYAYFCTVWMVIPWMDTEKDGATQLDRSLPVSEDVPFYARWSVIDARQKATFWLHRGRYAKYCCSHKWRDDWEPADPVLKYIDGDNEVIFSFISWYTADSDTAFDFSSTSITAQMILYAK